MYQILASERLTPNSKLFRVAAPHVARKAQAGQFVIVRADEYGERIPLTVADTDNSEGSITIIVQEVGKTTRKIASLDQGDGLATVVGPLGNPTEIQRYGTVVCIGGGFGVAAMCPVARALKAAGNYIISMTGARNVELLLWVDKVRTVSDEVHITTDDGSEGRKGLVVDPLKDMLAEGRKVDMVFAVGPVVMMRAVSQITQPYGIKTIASLNPIMVDGTGLCGACRVTVDGRTRFACVDGPDFDAHQVNWDELMARLRVYQPEEKIATERYQGKRA